MAPAWSSVEADFYITDYGKDGKGPRKAESEKPAEKPAESKTDSAAKESKSKQESSGPKPSRGKGGGKASKE